MNKNDLILFNDIINIFEYHRFSEAKVLHNHFIKIAQPTQDDSEQEALDIIAQNNLQDKFKEFAIKYFKSLPNFENEEDFEDIFETYGANNNVIAEQFLLSQGNNFFNAKEQTAKGEEIIKIVEELSKDNEKINKVNLVLKAAIKRGLPIAFILAGSAKLYYLLRYLIDNREELAKYASTVFGVISTLLSSIPPINFTLFNIQKIPSAYEMVDEYRVINVRRENNIYKYFVVYKTPDDNAKHEVIVETTDSNDKKETTKFRLGPNESINEPFTTNKKFKSIKITDNGKSVDSMSESQAKKAVESKESQKPKFMPLESKSDNKIEIKQPAPAKFTKIQENPQSTGKFKPVKKFVPVSAPKRKFISPNEENESSIDTSVLPPSTFKVRNINNLSAPEINVQTDPLQVSPSSKKIIPDIPKTEDKPDNRYYLEKKPETALNKPEELNTKRLPSKIPGVNILLEDLVESTMKWIFGEQFSMKVHEAKTNEYGDVEQFVEFLFPDKKKNFIMEFTLNGNTGRKSKEKHPADYFKKKSKWSLPRINLDDEQVQGILSGIMRKR